jgi:hypothetical protein
MDQSVTTIRYRFHLPGTANAEISLDFDRETFALRPSGEERDEPWTALDFGKCEHCPLAAAESPHCPFARAVSRFIHHFDAFYSYEGAVVEVVTEQRTMVAHGSVQQGLSSLTGLVGATCGCPRLEFFRPMAHFHLPFASEAETLYRLFSAQLLRQFVSAGAEGPVAVSLDGLQEQCESASMVNRGMAERLRAAAPKDAVVNGLIILDTFAQAAPYVIAERLAELRHLFAV